MHSKFFPKTIIRSILRIALCAIILFSLGALFLQEKVIFVPTKLPNNFQFKFDSSFEEKIFNFENSQIDSLLFHQNPSKGLILYFHGNAGSLDGWGDAAEELSKKSGWDVWIIDYPGYGKSTGKISSEDQLHNLATTFFKLALSQYPNTKIIIFGRSIGSGLAVKLASQNRVQGLILESPYFSLTSLAAHIAPWLPSSLLLKYTFHSDQWIRDVSSPILILHGTKDEVIPFSQGQNLANLRPDIQFQAIPNGHHNNLSFFPLYWHTLTDWINLR